MVSNAPPTPKRRGRGCLLWLGGAMILVLVLAGTLWESVSQASDTRAYPPADQMVDVGGYRLHIDCTGIGSPTVVIDAGWGDWSLSWSRVQAAVAASTRVCTYDRAGMGYSQAGPLPRDAEQFAKELQTLLDRAGVAGPYVMVGHSLGGLPVRVFTHEHPAEVAGVVLLESMSPDQGKGSAAATGSQAGSSSPPSLPSLLARIGFMRLITGPLGVSPNELPPEVRPAFRAMGVTPRIWRTWVDEGRGLPASMVEAGAVKSFGDLPLIVLTARLNKQAGWEGWQAGLLQLSSHSQQVFADKSDHNVQVDQPDAAVAAIVQMVNQLRQAAK